MSEKKKPSLLTDKERERLAEQSPEILKFRDEERAKAADDTHWATNYWANVQAGNEAWIQYFHQKKEVEEQECKDKQRKRRIEELTLADLEKRAVSTVEPEIPKRRGPKRRPPAVNPLPKDEYARLVCESWEYSLRRFCEFMRKNEAKPLHDWDWFTSWPEAYKDSGHKALVSRFRDGIKQKIIKKLEES